MHKMLTISCLMLIPLVLLGACRPTPPSSTPTPTQAPTTILPTIPLPPGGQYNFHLSSNAVAGDTDSYASQLFTFDLTKGQLFSLGFRSTDKKLQVFIFTPAKETWGYIPSQAASPNMGIFRQGRNIPSAEGSAAFTAPETGSYTLIIKSASPKAEDDISLAYIFQ